MPHTIHLNRPFGVKFKVYGPKVAIIDASLQVFENQLNICCFEIHQNLNCKVPTLWNLAYLLFVKLTNTDVFNPIRGYTLSTSGVSGGETEIEVKEEPVDIEEINFDYEEKPQDFDQESSEEDYGDDEERPRLRKRRKDGKAKVSKKMKIPVNWTYFSFYFTPTLGY